MTFHSTKAIAHALDTSLTRDAPIHGFAIDSRLLKPGDLFFALPGARVNGSGFLEEAARKGAALAIVPEEYQGPDYGLPLLRVPNVLLALQQLARLKLQQMQTKVVAITGSMGKTTTKEFAKVLLEAAYKLAASPLSYNSQRTLPLTILQTQETPEILLLEMGMSEPGEMANLVSIAPPDYALITTIALQHANNFPGGLEAIAQQKGVIFSHPKTSLALFPYEQSALSSFAQCETKSFSMTHSQANFFLERRENHLIFCEKGKRKSFALSFAARAHEYNFLAALAIARSLGVTGEQLQARISLLQPPPLRFERVERQGITFINDAYNANPMAVCMALADLPHPRKKGKKIAVLSEMDALGRFSEESHAAVATVALQHVDSLLCVGSRYQAVAPLWKGRSFECYATREELFARVKEIVREDDVVLLKGARSYRLEEILTLFLL